MDVNGSLNHTSVNHTSNLCAVEDLLAHRLLPTLYSLFFIVGFPANCLSLCVAWVLMRRGNNLAVYLVNLSISDLLYTVSLPVWIELALRRPVSDALCTTIAVVMFNSFYFGSGLLCCISVDRYLAVVYPLHFQWLREVRTALTVSAVAWCVELLVHFHLLAHTGVLRAYSSRRLCEERVPMTQEDIDVVLTRGSTGFLLPVLIMTLCFQRIMSSLRKSTTIQVEERNRIRNLLLLLLLTYLLSFAPYQLLMLLRAILEPSGGCSWARRLRDPYMVLVATTTLNSTLDPIIYCLISQSAKTEIIKVLRQGRAIFQQLQIPKRRTKRISFTS